MVRKRMMARDPTMPMPRATLSPMAIISRQVMMLPRTMLCKMPRDQDSPWKVLSYTMAMRLERKNEHRNESSTDCQWSFSVPKSSIRLSMRIHVYRTLSCRNVQAQITSHYRV